MRIKLFTLALILVACNVPSANAATVTEKIVVSGKTVFSFTVVDSLTLDSKGCKDVYIQIAKCCTNICDKVELLNGICE